MRKFATLIALVIAAGPVFGQFTMNRTDYPDVGDSQYYTTLDTTGILYPGPGGTGVTWDFSGALPGGGATTGNYADPATHPQAASYPNADVVNTYSNNTWWFWMSNADSVELNGDQSLTGTNITYSQAPTLIKFPFSYGDVISDTLTGEYFDGFLTNANTFGRFTTEFDGSGTLITPYATYNNVNRIKTTEVRHDSSWTGAAESDILGYKYEWFVQGRRTPVMVHHTRAVTVNGGNPTITYDYRYADTNLVAVDPGVLQQGLQVFPNPAQGRVQVSFELQEGADASVSILNALGQVVLNQTQKDLTAGTHEQQLSLEGLAPGMYFVRLSVQGQQVTQRLVIR